MYKKPNNYKNINSSQTKKEKKPDKKKSDLTEAQMKKLKEHSKSHKGGMQSSHIKTMIKNMKNGDSFSVAHKKAMKMDKEKSKK